MQPAFVWLPLRMYGMHRTQLDHGRLARPSITRNLITRVLTICHAVKPTQRIALENIRFSSLFASGDVSRGGMFLRAKRPQRRRATRNGCFCRLSKEQRWGKSVSLSPTLRNLWLLQASLLNCIVYKISM